MPSWATALFGADSSRWKPSTPVNVRGVLTGTPSTTRPRPGGRGGQAELRLPREDVHDLAGGQAVAVGRGHLDLVRGVRRRLAGRRDGERSGPSGQRPDERVEVGAVVQPDLGLDVAVVEVEARRVAGERVVGDRVACPVQLTFGRRGDGQLGRQPDLDHDRLRRGPRPRPPTPSGARCRRPSSA